MEHLVVDIAVGRVSGKTSIVCLNKLGALGTQIEHDVAIEVLAIPKNVFLATWTVYRALKALNPDIIHCHNLHAHFYGGICAMLLPNTKVVVTKHGQHIPTSGFASKINKYTLRESKIIGVSFDITQSMRQSITKNQYSIEYIANGISLSPYQALKPKTEAKKSLGIKESTFCVGIVARLSPPKDHLILIDAIADLAKTLPDIKLVIAGDGPLREKISTYINANNHNDIVTMLGERKDIANILNALDVFALTSSAEGIPMTILEAMAARLPFIATHVGGIPQVVIDNETGILLKDKDITTLIGALRQCIEHPQLRQKVGREGYCFLTNNYSIEQVMSKYESAYWDIKI